ncbi:MAG: hypothetical protein ACP5HL_02735, partial [Minisyncoccia bacterium]
MCTEGYFKIHGGEKMTINIKQLKLNFINKYPESPLARILLFERNEMTETEFLAKVGTWIAIFNIKE